MKPSNTGKKDSGPKPHFSVPRKEHVGQACNIAIAMFDACCSSGAIFWSLSGASSSIRSKRRAPLPGRHNRGKFLLL